MDQTKIWDFYQGEGCGTFAGVEARLSYLLKQVPSLIEERQLRVLNIGVGNGWVEAQAKKAGYEVWALDPSEVAIQRLREQGISARVGSIAAIPYEDNFFEVVFCSEVLEHLSADDLRAGVREIGRVLKPGGVLIGTVPYQENLLSNTAVCPHCGRRFHKWGHQQSFTAEGVRRLFPPVLQAEQVRVTYFVYWAGLNIKGKLVGVLKKACSLLGLHGKNENIVFVARKAESS